MEFRKIQRIIIFVAAIIGLIFTIVAFCIGSLLGRVVGIMLFMVFFTTYLILLDRDTFLKKNDRYRRYDP